MNDGGKAVLSTGVNISMVGKAAAKIMVSLWTVLKYTSEIS